MKLCTLAAFALIASSAIASGPATSGPATSGLATTGIATGPDSSRTFASLSISTGADTAWVFIDTVRLGRTPWRSDSLSPGTHRLRLVETDVSSWLTGSIVDTVVLSPGEERSLRYTFERWVTIITDPSGAVVRIGDSLAGTTPLVLLARGEAERGPILVEKQGFEATTVPLSAFQGGISRTILKKIWQPEGPDGSVTPGDEAGRNSLRLYVVGGATLVAGVAAAYFKIKADGRNAAFLETGDPWQGSETRRLDTAAAVALAIMQVNFALLTYFLLSE